MLVHQSYTSVRHAQVSMPRGPRRALFLHGLRSEPMVNVGLPEEDAAAELDMWKALIHEPGDGRAAHPKILGDLVFGHVLGGLHVGILSRSSS